MWSLIAERKLIIKFINGMANSIDQNSYPMGVAGGRLGVALVKGMANGILGSGGVVLDAALSVASSALESAKNFLGIGSPSRVFHEEVGRPIAQGMAGGIDRDAPLVVDAIDKMGHTAVDKLKSTMNGVSDVFKMEADMNPVIAPVLDLTNVTREANKMHSILATRPLRADVSYRRASDISSETRAAQGTTADDSNTSPLKAVNLVQNNYSPKALSAIEIYRSTRNQLSLAKEALTV